VANHNKKKGCQHAEDTQHGSSLAGHNVASLSNAFSKGCVRRRSEAARQIASQVGGGGCDKGASTRDKESCRWDGRDTGCVTRAEEEDRRDSTGLGLELWSEILP